MSNDTSSAARFAGWAAIFGGIVACLHVTLDFVLLGDDFAMSLHGASMLALPEATRDLFRWAMVADILGFYLPVLAIAGYLWRRFRDEAGAWGDMAVLTIVVYVVLGVSGAAIQMAVLQPLAHLHHGGDEATRLAAETTWAALAHASQKGLWWCEGPLVLFWGTVVGQQLAHAGWGRPVLILLKIVGWSFGLFFLFEFFPSLAMLAELTGLIIILAFPLWMLLFGWKLLRQPTSAAA